MESIHCDCDFKSECDKVGLMIGDRYILQDAKVVTPHTEVPLSRREPKA